MCLSARLLMPTILCYWLLLQGSCANYCLCAVNLRVDSMYCLNAKKSKCLYIRHKEVNRSNSCLKPIFNIGGNAIEFVRQWLHLGNLINDMCDDKDDILKKTQYNVRTN